MWFRVNNHNSNTHLYITLALFNLSMGEYDDDRTRKNRYFNIVEIKGKDILFFEKSHKNL